MKPVDETGRRRVRGVRTVLLLCLAASLVVLGRPFVHSDGASYFATSLSLARDGDFDLGNQWYLRDRTEARIARDYAAHGGRRASTYSGGTALLNFPFLWPIVRLHDDLGFLAGLDALGENLQGVPLAFSAAVLAASFVYLCLGALAAYETARHWLSDWWALAVTLAVLYSLPVVVYGTWEPGFCHAGGAFLVAAALWLTAGLVMRGNRRVLRLVLIGACLGLAAFVRASTGALMVPWAVYLGWRSFRGGGIKRAAAGLGAFAAGAAPFVALLCYYNWVSYGHPLRTDYQLRGQWLATQHPLGPGLLFWARNTAFLLGHPVRGVFVWAPVCAAGVAGLGCQAIDARLRSLARLCFAAALAGVVMMGLWGNWWGGQSAGPRFFVELWPFFVVGLAAFVGRTRRARAAAGIGLALLTLYAFWTQVSYVAWRATPHARLVLRERRWGIRRGEGYTPVDVLVGNLYPSWGVTGQSANRDPAPSFVSRFVDGVQPSLVHLTGLALGGRLPAAMADLTAEPDRQAGQLLVTVTLDKPLRRSTQLVLDVYENRGPVRSRGRRWGRLVSESLPMGSSAVTLTVRIDVAAGQVSLTSEAGPIGLPGRRVEDDHRQVTAEATHLYVEAALRREAPDLLPCRRWTVIPNPWQTDPGAVDS